jgi:hypothetical protein
VLEGFHSEIMVELTFCTRSVVFTGGGGGGEKLLFKPVFKIAFLFWGKAGFLENCFWPPIRQSSRILGTLA